MYTIFCDMDGVLVDFEKGYTELTNTGSSAKPGAKLYLSTTPGKFQTWSPTGSGEVSRLIGYCFNDQNNEVALYNNTIYFCPDTNYIENV